MRRPTRQRDQVGAILSRNATLSALTWAGGARTRDQRITKPTILTATVHLQIVVPFSLIAEGVG